MTPSADAVAREVIAGCDHTRGDDSACLGCITTALVGMAEGARARAVEACATLLQQRAAEHERIAVDLITADRTSEMALTHKSMAHTYHSAAQQVRALVGAGA